MRKWNLIIVLTFYCLFLASSTCLANDGKNERFILRASIAGLRHHQVMLNSEVPKELSIRKFGVGTNLQFGFISGKKEQSEYRHYIELNQVKYTADVEYLGSYKANMLFLSFSPFQYHVQLNPESANIIDLEIGVTLGFNLLSVYNYNFLNNERRSVKDTEEITIAGFNMAFSTERVHFNKMAEMGVKLRISPIFGVIEVDQSYSGLEFFYGIKF